jgi:hypothetical protein
MVEIARREVLEHAPLKQYLPKTGRATGIGRTPGAACDAMAFLARLIDLHGPDARASDKMHELALWVIDLQRQSLARVDMAAVPSTPDAPPPDDGFYYAIDAAICGRGMLKAHRVTGDPAYLMSARGFGDVLELMAEQQEAVFENASARGGFCEYASLVDGRVVYNCDSHVKLLYAVGFLRELAEAAGEPARLTRARAAREFLIQGLRGAWEHADASATRACPRAPCAVVWRRVDGPKGEPDRFVYGDTLAYALAGLYIYEGASPQVADLYRRFSSYEGHDPRTRRFDGRIAFAGYMIPELQAPDPFSAYYDLVTIGLLRSLRRDIAPEHDARAWAFLQRILRPNRVPRWGVDFDGSALGVDAADVTMLATLGVAALTPDDL